jgi:hypothetical protein
VNLGLGHKQLPTRLEAGVDLAQQPSLIWDFVDRERQGEVGLGIYAEAIRFALVGVNPVSHARLPCPPQQHTEHLLLEIRANN